MEPMMFWLSFADASRPQGTQFLGASQEQAVRRCHRAGANPGGEMMSMQIPNSFWDRCRPHLNRLMQRTELEKLFGPMIIRAEMAELVQRVPVNEDSDAPIQGICRHVNDSLKRSRHRRKAF